MAEEAVIYPSQPLFIVDRGWQRQKNRSKNRALVSEGDIQPWRVPEVTINVVKGAAHNSSSQRNDGMPATEAKHQAADRLTFMNYDPTKGNRKSKTVSKARNTSKVSRRQKSSQTTRVASPIKPESVSLVSPTLTKPIPRTTSPMYSCLDPEVSDFQSFLSYYPTRMAAASYPIRQYVPLKFNPIETIWYPAVVSDEVFLHAILFSSALHFSLLSGHSTFKGSELLTRAILDRLNRKLHSGNYSDTTIGAVSCLALCGNQTGDSQQWEMHIAGMSGMIRARGGMRSVESKMQMKLHRADIFGSVDGLIQPHLPRPIRRSRPLYDSAGVNLVLIPVVPLLLDVNLNPRVFNALVDLASLCLAVNFVAENQLPIDPFSFDEDTTCIAHDLLTSYNPAHRNAEQACLIVALILVQTLTRERPFAKRGPARIAQALKENLQSLESEAVPPELMLWILLMGSLVSINTDERDWFHQKLRDFQHSRNDLRMWENARSQLKQTFWIDAIHDRLGEVMWHDIFDNV